MIKLIASDIDGTLVKDGTLAIDREYMEVIGRLIDKGIVFVACSGRQYRSERKLFTPVADRLLYISDGGTVVRTPKEILKVDTLPDEIWKGMCSMVRGICLPVIILFPHLNAVSQKTEAARCFTG